MRFFPVAFASLAIACSARTSNPVEVTAPTEPLATLTLRWSLAGSRDPVACPRAFAEWIDISIVDLDTQGEVAALQQSCESFHTSVTLVPGAYAVRARLVDAAEHPRTTEVSVTTLTVRSDEELVQDVDFPHDSFL